YGGGAAGEVAAEAKPKKNAERRLTILSPATMPNWPAAKAKRVLAALIRIGWTEKRRSGSHRTLERAGWKDITWAFHDDVEIGPPMLARLAKSTGLTPGD